MTSIKDELPTGVGWYFCKFYNNTFGGFRVRCLSQAINGKTTVMHKITDIHTFEPGEKMVDTDITHWQKCE